MSDEYVYYNLKEGLNISLKDVEKGLPKSIFETYSAFANTSGGKIYLGIKARRPNEVVGLFNLDELKSELLTILNDPNRVSKNILKESDFKKIELSDGRVIIEINVKEASIYDKPIYLDGNIFNSFKRNYEGDYKIDLHTLASISNDAKGISLDTVNNKLDIGFESVDVPTLESYRLDLNKSNPDNIYKLYSNEEFMIQMGYLNLNRDGVYVLSNGGLLLFTTPAAIKRVYAGYFLDCQLKNEIYDFTFINRVTSDDIDYVGNLYNFYKRALSLLASNSSDELRLMIRDGLLNSIANFDFSFNDPLKCIKSNSRVEFINEGRLKASHDKAIKSGNSDFRNKQIATTFSNLKIFERNGSGIPKMLKISEKLNYYRPLLIDDAVDNKTKLTIYLKTNPLIKDDNFIAIFNYLESNDEFISILNLSKNVGINRTTVSQIVNRLIDDGVVMTNGLVTKGKMVKLR